MTRIYVQRGSGSGSSSNTNRSTLSTSSGRPEAQVNPTATTAQRDEETLEVGQELDPINELVGSSSINAINEDKVERNDEASMEQISILCKEGFANEVINLMKVGIDSSISQPDIAKGFDGLRISESIASQKERLDDGSSQVVFVCEGADPPPPPIPPPKPVITNTSSRRVVPSSSNSVRIGSSKKTWPVGPAMSSPSHSRPSSPRSHGESEGYNSADEHNPGFVSSYADMEKERKFEIDIRRVKGLEVKKMLEDGNCFFRAVADQVYGDSEAYDLIRQMCVDYMERERDHFSQFITEGFTSYCKRKRRDKVYGNNVEIQALAEMYSRPIHIYSYSTEPINIFQGSYITDLPPIRLSYHQGNHYNSLVDPRRSTIGAGLGFSSLRGANVGMDQVKAAIKAQQDQQIDNVLLAEGRFYSDLELTEKEIERMVMDASRAEYLMDDKLKHQISYPDSSASSAEPSSSGTPGSSGSEPKAGTAGKEHQEKSVLSNSMQVMLSMGFSYLQAAEAYSIFGDDIDSMVCYLVETGNNAGRRKGKAAE